MGSPLLKIDRLQAGYGDLQVLWDISMEVEEGSITTLIGSNGSGKTTTLRAVSGLIVPRQGDITYGGVSVVGRSVNKIAELGIAHIPEGRRLFPNMTVQENLDMGAFAPPARARRRETLSWVFDLFPRLRERRRQMAGTLSGGEQQMVAIARGLMACPRLLMLDEPSGGLMPRLVSELFGILREIKRRGVTILLVEQHVEESLELSSRFYVLETGRIVQQGRSTEFFQDRRLQEAYLGL